MTRRARKLPAPADKVISKSFGDEFILYHEETFQSASLTGVSAQVWRAALGGADPDATDEQIDTAVAELIDLGFLTPPPGVSRRNVLRGALIGGAALSLSGIESILAPTAAVAQTATTIEFTTAGTHTLTVPSGTIVTYTLVGGGGGGGAAGTSAKTAGAGGASGAAFGTMTTGGTKQTFTVIVGAGGTGGVFATGATASGGPGGSGYGAGGAGGTVSGATTENVSGAGGGGGTALYASALTPAIVAGGGGGGGSFFGADGAGGTGGIGTVNNGNGSGGAGGAGKDTTAGGGTNPVTGGTFGLGAQNKGTSGVPDNGFTGGTGPNATGGAGGVPTPSSAGGAGGGGGGGGNAGGGGGGASEAKSSAGGGAGANFATSITNLTVVPSATAQTGALGGTAGAVSAALVLDNMGGIPGLQSGTGVASVTSGPFTPTANAVLVVVANSFITTGAIIPALGVTDSLGTLTWLGPTQATNSSQNVVTALFRAQVPATSAKMTVTVSCSNLTPTVLAYFIAEVAGGSASLGAIGTGSGASSASVTLSASPASTSVLVAGVGWYATKDDGNATIPAQFSRFAHDHKSSGTPTSNVEIDEDSTPPAGTGPYTWSVPTGNGESLAMVLVEIPATNPTNGNGGMGANGTATFVSSGGPISGNPFP